MQVKAAFTRAYNKEGHLNPFAPHAPVKRGRGSVAEEVPEEDGDWEEGGSLPEVEEQEDDITHNPMIKIKANTKQVGGGASGVKASTKQVGGGADGVKRTTKQVGGGADGVKRTTKKKKA